MSWRRYWSFCTKKPNFDIEIFNQMDIQTEKLELIEWLSKLSDTSTIKELKAIRKGKEADWWDSLSKAQKEDIEAGLSDLESGRKKILSKVLSKFQSKI